VSKTHDLRRLLRWYPPKWRSRYGDEFLALLEDRLRDAPLTWRFRSSVAMAGVRERCYGSGVVGTRSAPLTQRRTGSLMVLVAWSIMIVGGAGLAKTAEHFSAALPAGSRSLAQMAYNTTAVAGIAGSLLVVVGGLVALPGFLRLLRAKQWSQVRQKFERSLIASAVVIASTVGLSLWAHHLTSAQRNGANGWYSLVFIAWALVVVTTLGLWTAAGVDVASRIDFTPRELRWESGLALGVCLSSLVVVATATLWWIQVGVHAPWFLEGSTAGVATSPWSAQLVAIVVVLALGTITAIWGASRVVVTYRPNREHAR